jgi:hypothetical protein
MREAIDNQIVRSIGCRIGRSGRSPFIGATDKAGPVTRTPRGVQVEVVACHHHDRARLELQQFSSLLIRFWPRLVHPEHFARDHRVPMEPIAARGIDDQREAENRER